MPDGIHEYHVRYARARTVLESANIPQQAKDQILAFDSYIAARGLGLPRRVKYLEILRQLANELHVRTDFLSVTKDQLLNYLAGLEARNYKDWTKTTLKKIIKRYWKWLKGNDEQYPEEVKWIKAGMARNKRPLPKAEDLLTEEDIAKLLEHAKTIRDRAFISTLWETGTRISELGNLTLGDVRFDQLGGILSVNGKTGPRRVRIIQSVPHLSRWIDQHPNKGRPNAPLWVVASNYGRGNRILYQALRTTLRRVSRAAGIKKRVNPHAFRHARATFLAKHLTEFQMNQYLG